MSSFSGQNCRTGSLSQPIQIKAQGAGISERCSTALGASGRWAGSGRWRGLGREGGEGLVGGRGGEGMEARAVWGLAEVVGGAMAGGPPGWQGLSQDAVCGAGSGPVNGQLRRHNQESTCHCGEIKRPRVKGLRERPSPLPGVCRIDPDRIVAGLHQDDCRARQFQLSWVVHKGLARESFGSLSAAYRAA